MLTKYSYRPGVEGFLAWYWKEMWNKEGIGEAEGWEGDIQGPKFSVPYQRRPRQRVN